MTMSSENLVPDVEKGTVVVVRESRPRSDPWKCLGISSFLLLVGATIVLAFLHFRAGQQALRESRALSEPLEAGPRTMKLQAERAQKPAAHVVATIEGDHLKWDAEVAPTMLLHGMKLVKNKLVVPQNGLYFVYSQVVFRGQACPEEDLSLTISRYAVEYPTDKALLTAFKSVCVGSPAPGPSPTSDQWLESLYQGAVFRLEKGDEISSQPASTKYVDAESDQVYFGVIGMD
ncbi:tumor necrosis factor [Alligator sinensis]|uniref:Tumor necrosis factor n=1 Tax=Alligator sinensis TaxID=38654 RepID=A0A1U8DJL0_ALLSI|nr:tumor necrosis factor [Alligator sinensis]